jgi:hypothetical protein
VVLEPQTAAPPEIELPPLVRPEYAVHTMLGQGVSVVAYDVLARSGRHVPGPIHYARRFLGP